MLANGVTIFRTLLTIPLFALLAFGAGAYGWAPLALFLGCGALDVVDGKVARALGQTSRFGAMIDLLGDRMLTLAAVSGLIAGGAHSGLVAAAGVLLVARDLVVASLNEAAPGALTTRGGLAETIKIALAFGGLTLLIAPRLHPLQAMAGESILCLAAVGAALTTAGYWRRGMTALHE